LGRSSTTFKPGQITNPKGRPPAIPPEIKALAQTWTLPAVDALGAALKNSGERVGAATILLAYGYGKPVQPTEFTGTVIHALMAMPANQRLERAHSLIARAQALIAQQTTEPDPPTIDGESGDG